VVANGAHRIVDGEHRIVVVRRGGPPSQGLWSLPGGRVEQGETLEQAAQREVWEETGLEVRIGDVAGRVDIPHGLVVYDVTDFMATVVGPAGLVAGDDATDARWVTRSELVDLPCSPGLVEALDAWAVWTRV
jgi:ADP-ribose pyrophosphatase YjhB (NUDIX family)